MINCLLFRAVYHFVYRKAKKPSNIRLKFEIFRIFGVNYFEFAPLRRGENGVEGAPYVDLKTKEKSNNRKAHQ